MQYYILYLNTVEQEYNELLLLSCSAEVDERKREKLPLLLRESISCEQCGGSLD